MGELREKTGLVALAGTLKAIDAGTIPKGSRVLWCLTSGVSHAEGEATAEFEVNDPQDLLEEYEAHLSLAAQHG